MGLFDYLRKLFGRNKGTAIRLGQSHQTVQHGDIAESVERQIIQGTPIISSRRRVLSHEGNVIRDTTDYYFVASCGHFYRSGEQLAGICQYKECGAMVCHQCLARCNRCSKLICPKHQKLHDGLLFCPTCKLFVLLFGFKHLRGWYG
jgi:hypothetical protein